MKEAGAGRASRSIFLLKDVRDFIKTEQTDTRVTSTFQIMYLFILKQI